MTAAYWMRAGLSPAAIGGLGAFAHRAEVEAPARTEDEPPEEDAERDNGVGQGVVVEQDFADEREVR